MSPQLLKYGIVALAIAGVFFAHRVIVKRAENESYTRGFIAARAEFLTRENEELAKRNMKIVELESKYRELEHRAAGLVADISNLHVKEIRRVETQRDAALADAKRFRLQWTTQCTPGERPAGDRTAETPAAPGGVVGTAQCELPDEVRGSLIDLAAQADRVVAERNALLAIAKADREVCK